MNTNTVRKMKFPDGLDSFLHRCMTNKSFEEFPTFPDVRKIGSKSSFIINTICICEMPTHWDEVMGLREEQDDDLVVCDNCLEEFHPKCVEDDRSSDDFLCLKCKFLI